VGLAVVAAGAPPSAAVMVVVVVVGLMVVGNGSGVRGRKALTLPINVAVKANTVQHLTIMLVVARVFPYIRENRDK